MSLKRLAIGVRSWCAGHLQDAKGNCFRLGALLSVIILLLVWSFLDLHQCALPWEHFRPLAEKVVEALFIAATLALTVDWFLKKEIARDAFRASIGYILPDYLQDEIRAIYSNEIVCTNHSQDVKIEVVDNDLVRMKVRVERTFKNISNNPHRFMPKLSVDEWFVAGAPSTIDDCGYRTPRGDERFGAASTGADPVPKLYAEGCELTLRPQTEVEVWLSFSEIKRRSDLSYLAFSYATKKPRVRLTVPDDFDSAVEFTHRLDAKRLTTNETILPGLLLPHQCIIVRWWEKAKKEEWESTHSIKPPAG
jgi:hypothetical protein